MEINGSVNEAAIGRANPVEGRSIPGRDGGRSGARGFWIPRD